ncbi:hypothetical protein, partial [Actinomadura sp. NPDC048955]|uniref:hypothetical protein n=1 Tax=Actinomadura sp. NPDC048955 TaxID=3158228 RepID=UPI0033D6DD2A
EPHREARQTLPGPAARIEPAAPGDEGEPHQEASPASIYFKLLDESLKEYELLFLGIFHTYLYGE